MGEGNRGLKLGQIDHIGGIVFCVRVRLVNLEIPFGMLLQICHGLLIHREDAVLSAGLNGHIADGKPVVHSQVLYALAGKFHGFVESAVHADHADDVQDDILAGESAPIIASPATTRPFSGSRACSIPMSPTSK